MARNEEKQLGRLNRLYLQKEKEEYEKKHPKRPRLDCLDTVEEIQKWLPSIKRDLDFYLKKSLVVCYSDDHIEECKLKVVHLEKEYKAFVRKIAQLTPGKLDAIPWTNRAYKRKNLNIVDEPQNKKEFKPIHTPILSKEEPSTLTYSSTFIMPYMDEPLSFKPSNKNVMDSTLQIVNKTTVHDSSSKVAASDNLDAIVNNGHSSTLVNYADSDSDS